MKQFFFLAIAVAIHGAATRSDWKVFPMTEPKAQIPLDLICKKSEFASIAQGFIPRNMDDRWVIVVENGHIFFYRSWTGAMIYDCVFEEKGDEIWISSMYANRNAHECSNTDDESDILQITDLLNWLVSQNSK
ncbi:MAG: hypothetical protein K1X28_09165 [Parachlamydiales bacterium]|nr:hypothetical protein [Parachlamydiales bacterium]